MSQFDTGSVPRRQLHFFLLCDVSASPDDSKIRSINRRGESLVQKIRQLQAELAEVANVDMFLRVIRFGDGASMPHHGTPVEDAEWHNIDGWGSRAGLGSAVTLLTEALRPERLGAYQYPPVVILLSYGRPTDDWEDALQKFNLSPYGLRPHRTVRVAVAIGNDANRDVLMQFTGNMETVFDDSVDDATVAESMTAIYGYFSWDCRAESNGSITLLEQHSSSQEKVMSQFDTGAVALRKLHFFLLCDVSGSMGGAKIQSLNQVAESLIPLMNRVQAAQAQAEMFLRVIEFGEGAAIRDAGQPTPVEGAKWDNLLATGGRTDLGSALTVLTAELGPERLGPYQYPPCIILLSDGNPTDRWEEALQKFNESPYGKRPERTVRVAVAIGNDADRSVLMRFTGSIETVFDAHSAAQLEAVLKFVTVASLSNSFSSSGDGLNPNASGEAFKEAAIHFKASATPQRDPNDVIF
jgi:uncharacterized protein YegL